MKNLKTILAEHGIEPSDYDAIEKDVLANYVTRPEFEQKTAKAKDADTLQAKITDLEADKDSLQKVIDAYGDAKPEDVAKIKTDYETLKKQMDDKAAADEKAKSDREFNEAFKEAVGTDREFDGEFNERGIRDEVRKLHEANPAKGLADLINEVAKDKPVWKNPQKPTPNPVAKPDEKTEEEPLLSGHRFI